jgi:hypothetical protein
MDRIPGLGNGDAVRCLRRKSPGRTRAIGCLGAAHRDRVVILQLKAVAQVWREFFARWRAADSGKLAETCMRIRTALRDYPKRIGIIEPKVNVVD